MSTRPRVEAVPHRDRPLILALLLLGLSLGVALRVGHVATPFLVGDEIHSLDASRPPVASIVTRFDAFGTHVPLPLFQHEARRVFGTSLWSFRLPVLTAGILTLLVCFPVSRLLIGGPAALLVTWALALSPMHVFYSHFGRSYSIAVLFVLLLAGAFVRAEEGGRRAPWYGLAAAALIALAAWTHLSAAGVVAGLSAAFLLGARTGEGAAFTAAGFRTSPWGIGPRVVVLTAGALFALLLYLPVWDQVWDYLRLVPLEARKRPSGPFGIADVLAGGRVSGFVWLFLLPLSAVVLWVRDRAAARWLLPPAAGSIVFLLAFGPHGREFAWSRYLLAALPFLAALPASFAVILARRLVRDRRAADRRAIAAGLAALAVVTLAGPISPLRPDAGPYANTYLTLKPLSAFEAPWPEAPEIYRRLAGDSTVKRILEVPPRAFRPLLLYECYYRIHRKPTFLAGEYRRPSRPSPPYFSLEEVLAWTEPPVEYVILHRDIMKETNDYWDYVYGVAWSGGPLGGDAGFMKELDRPRRPWHPPSTLAAMATAFTTRFGEPAFEDDVVIAWDLRGERAGPPEGHPAE